MNIWRAALAAGSVIASSKALSTLRDVNSNDMLGLIGLERRRSALDGVLPAVGYFLGGAAVGAGVALLLAPMAGTELRGEISRKASNVKDRAVEKIHEIEERVQHSAGNAVGSARHESTRSS